MGLGSSWYHLDPSNETLLWDRLPISTAFMAFLSAVFAERLDRRAGIVALLPLIAFGIFSVLYWHFTEQGEPETCATTSSPRATRSCSYP